MDGDRDKARRLLAAYGVSLLLVIALQYAGFLPVLLREVLPHAASGRAASPAGTGALSRFALFNGLLAPAVALIGAV